MLQLTVPYLNAMVNVKPKTQNSRLELTCQAKPSETCRLMGTGPGLVYKASAGGVGGQVGNQTDSGLWSTTGPIAGSPDPL
jgi:hypothetical protein